MSAVVRPHPPHQPITFSQILSAKECADLIEDTASYEFKEAAIRVGHDYSQLVIDRSYRWVHFLKIPQTSEFSWLYQRLIAYAHQASEVFNVKIEGEFLEPIRLLRYEIGGHYKEHTDAAKQGAVAGRCISIVVQLSAPKDYGGGSLIFTEMGQVAGKDQGSATFFPSMWMHQVEPITRGTRFALIAWVNKSRSSENSALA